MEMNQFTLSLSGIRCEKCVTKIKSALIKRDLDVSFTANESNDKAELITRLSPKQAISVIASIGYVATISNNHLYETLTTNVSGYSGEPNLSVLDVKAPKKIKKFQELEEKDQSKADFLSKKQRVNLSLIGITCASCVNSIESALKKLSDVESVNINFANRTATVQSSQSAQSLIQAIRSIGYDASEILDENAAHNDKTEREAKEYRLKIRQSIASLSLGVPLMIYGLFGGAMTINTTLERSIWLIIGLMTFALLWLAGRHFFIGAWKAFLNRNAKMDTLIALGTGTAWLYSMVVVMASQWLPESSRHLYFEATAMIIGLINLGQALELKARAKTSQSIKRLLNLRVKTAVVVRHNEEIILPIEQVIVGDKIRVRAGEKIPVDGVIIEGNTSIDESMLTGEPIPVEKHSKSKISAGTLNGQGSVLIEAQKVGSDTALAQIITIVAQAQNSKPPISHLADKVSAVFVPAVIILAILTALVWYNFGPEPILAYMIVAATSVLIIACPCALGLATPISTMIGIGKAAEFGGLIRNGEALQRASEIDVIVLDKTGTITQGEPKVTNFYSSSNDDSILHLVEALEKGSCHPLAQALSNYTKEYKVAISNEFFVTDFLSLTGMGVQASYNNKKLLLGNEKLMHQFDLNTSKVSHLAMEWERNANTVVYFAVDNEIKALFGISDPIREDAKKAIERFHQQNIHVVMLTGDNENTAKAVASLVNIDEFYAQLMPKDKLDWIKRLQARNRIVGMVGDGINDAPALAQSDVGFAIGSGTDVAIESADITLMRNSLIGVCDIIGISNATMKNIRQNLWGAFIYNSLGIPIAAGLLFPFTGWLLSPIIAGAAMSLSSITVVLNANCLRLYKPDKNS